MRAAIGVGVDSLLAANSINPTSIMAAIKNGIAAGVKAIGFDFGSSGGSGGVFGALSSKSVTGAIESALGQEGIFSNILGVVKNALLSPINAVSNLVNTAFNGLKEFTDLIQEKGLGGAFESIATSVFSRQTIERLIGQTGGVAGVIETAAKVVTILNGQSVQEQNLGGGTSLFYDLAGAFIGKKENGVTQLGTFGQTKLGKWGLIAGTLISNLAGDLVFAGEVQDGQLMRGTLSGPNGTIGVFNPEGGQGPIIIDGRDESNSGDSGGSFWNLIFKFLPLSVDYVFNQGSLKETQINQTTQLGAASSTTLAKTTHNLFGNGFNNDIVPEGTFDGLIPEYVLNLNMDGAVKLFETMIIPLYETTNLFGNMADWSADFILNMQNESWVRNFLSGGAQILSALTLLPPLKNLFGQIAFGIGNGLVDEVWGKMLIEESLRGRLENGVAFSHSGFFSPLINALSKPRPDGTDFDVETIINYEGVHPGFFGHNAFIDNPNLKRIINVWGTAPTDPLFTANGQWTGQFDSNGLPIYDTTKKPVQVGDFGPPEFSFSNAAFVGPSGITNINIEIVGARHNDFVFDPYAWNDHPYEPERKAREINRLTNLFMRNLYAKVVEDQEKPGALMEFLRNHPNVQQEATTGVWEVDFGEV